MDIAKVNAPNFQPESKESPQVEGALETRAQKRAELLKGAKATSQVQPQSKQSSQAVV
jgi:hypothetical protein